MTDSIGKPLVILCLEPCSIPKIESEGGRGCSLVKCFEEIAHPILVSYNGRFRGCLKSTLVVHFTNQVQAVEAGLSILRAIHGSPGRHLYEKFPGFGLAMGLDQEVARLEYREPPESLDGPTAAKCLRMLTRCWELQVEFMTTTSILQEESLGRDLFPLLPKRTFHTRYVGNVSDGVSSFHPVYEIYSHDDIRVIEYKSKASRSLTHGINLFSEGNYAKAYQILGTIQREHGALGHSDCVVRHFLDQCRGRLEGFVQSPLRTQSVAPIHRPQ